MARYVVASTRRLLGHRSLGEGVRPIACKPKSVAVERTIPMTIPVSNASALRPMRREETWEAGCVLISFLLRKSAISIGPPIGHTPAPLHARPSCPGPYRALPGIRNEGSGSKLLRHLLR